MIGFELGISCVGTAPQPLLSVAEIFCYTGRRLMLMSSAVPLLIIIIITLIFQFAKNE